MSSAGSRTKPNLRLPPKARASRLALIGLVGSLVTLAAAHLIDSAWESEEPTTLPRALTNRAVFGEQFPIFLEGAIALEANGLQEIVITRGAVIGQSTGPPDIGLADRILAALSNPAKLRREVDTILEQPRSALWKRQTLEAPFSPRVTLDPNTKTVRISIPSASSLSDALSEAVLVSHLGRPMRVQEETFDADTEQRPQIYTTLYFVEERLAFTTSNLSPSVGPFHEPRIESMRIRLGSSLRR